MTEDELRDRIREGRDFCRPYGENDNDFLTDQEQHIPQPPLFKAPMSEEEARKLYKGLGEVSGE